MIKIITFITKFILITLAALLFASCNEIINHRNITGSGNITTEKRNVNGDFKNIEVSNAIDVVIEQADVTEVIVEADDNLQKAIVTKVENGVLIIGCDYNSFTNIGSKKVTVKMPVINGFEASSAATIKSKNVLKGDNINISASSGSNINVNVEFDNISLDSDSAGNITVLGKTLQLKTSASSGSVINAEDLLANEVIAEVSSGANINTHPILSLNAEASSGGSITYNSDPKSIQQNSNSGGSINRQ